LRKEINRRAFREYVVEPATFSHSKTLLGEKTSKVKAKGIVDVQYFPRRLIGLHESFYKVYSHTVYFEKKKSVTPTTIKLIAFQTVQNLKKVIKKNSIR